MRPVRVVEHPVDGALVRIVTSGDQEVRVQADLGSGWEYVSAPVSDVLTARAIARAYCSDGIGPHDEFERGQWDAFNQVLNYLNTLGDDDMVTKGFIYKAVMDMRPT